MSAVGHQLGVRTSANHLAHTNLCACAAIMPAACPVGKTGLPGCTESCGPDSFNDGTLAVCAKCPAGTVPDTDAGSCVGTNPTVCDPGYAVLPGCLKKCAAGEWNNGSFSECQPCEQGKVSEEGAAGCAEPQRTECPPGREGLPSCNRACPADTFNDGTSTTCLSCKKGMTSGEGAAACTYTGAAETVVLKSLAYIACSLQC